MLHLIITILTGALAGLIAGKIMNTKKRSFLINLILGVVGGFVGHLIFGSTTWIGGLVVAVVGACALIWLSKKILK